MINKNILGQNIMLARKKVGLSQSDLGRKFGNISHAAISDIERGKTSLTDSEVESLAEFLETSYKELTSVKPSSTAYFRRGVQNLSNEEILNEEIALKKFTEFVNKMDLEKK